MGLFPALYFLWSFLVSKKSLPRPSKIKFKLIPPARPQRKFILAGSCCSGKISGTNPSPGTTPEFCTATPRWAQPREVNSPLFPDLCVSQMKAPKRQDGMKTTPSSSDLFQQPLCDPSMREFGGGKQARIQEWCRTECPAVLFPLIRGFIKN